MNLLKGLFSGTPNISEEELKAALIVDVRSEEEFNQGHVTGSVNIPLQNVQAALGDLRKSQRPIVMICRSGARSGMAVATLQQAGISAKNGGGWQAIAAVLH